MGDPDRLTLSCPDGRTAFLPGEIIEIAAEWQLAEPAREVELRLFWSTAGVGAQDAALIGRRVIGVGSAGGGRHTLQLPESPYSFSGTLISLVWGIELVVDGGRSATRLEIVIAPERREVSLHTPDATSPARAG
jgi:hypothetical protein